MRVVLFSFLIVFLLFSATHSQERPMVLEDIIEANYSDEPFIFYFKGELRTFLNFGRVDFKARGENGEFGAGPSLEFEEVDARVVWFLPLKTQEISKVTKGMAESMLRIYTQTEDIAESYHLAFESNQVYFIRKCFTGPFLTSREVIHLVKNWNQVDVPQDTSFEEALGGILSLDKEGRIEELFLFSKEWHIDVKIFWQEIEKSFYFPYMVEGDMFYMVDFDLKIEVKELKKP